MEGHIPILIQWLRPRRKFLRKFYFILVATAILPSLIKGLLLGFVDPFTGYLGSLGFFLFVAVGYLKADDFLKLVETLTTEEDGPIDSLLGKDAGRKLRMNTKRCIDNRRREYLFSVGLSFIVILTLLLDFSRGALGHVDGEILYPWTHISYGFSFLIFLFLLAALGSGAHIFICLIRSVSYLSSHPIEIGLKVDMKGRNRFAGLQQEISSFLRVRYKIRPILNLIVSLAYLILIIQVILLTSFSYNLIVRGFIDYITMILILIAGTLALLPSFLPQYSFHKTLTRLKREILFKLQIMRIQAETSSLLAAQKDDETNLKKADSFRSQALTLKNIQKDVDEIGTWIYDVRELKAFISITQAPSLVLLLQTILAFILK